MINKVITLIIGSLILSSCSDDRKDCSDSFATIFFVQDDIDKLLKQREDFNLTNSSLVLISNKTDILISYFEAYENSLFRTIDLKKPMKYNFEWCMSLEHNDHYKILTDKLVGEPCELVTGEYSVTDLFNQLNKYNDFLDSVANTSYCNDNPYFDWIINPKIDKCLRDGERFYSMNLNNHIISILRLKEAILNQELVIREKIN